MDREEKEKTVKTVEKMEETVTTSVSEDTKEAVTDLAVGKEDIEPTPSPDKELNEEKSGEKDVEENKDDDSLFGSSSDEEAEKKEVNKTEENKIDSDSDNSVSDGGTKKKKKRLRKGKVTRRSRSNSKDSTKKDEDNAFIDSDDDNPDAAKSYKEQKEYASDEEDPFLDDQKMTTDNQPFPQGDTEIDDILSRLKGKGRKRGDGMTEEEREDFVHSMLLQMDLAFNKDIQCKKENKPCLNKIKILNSVVEALSKSSLQTVFLEKNLLQVLGAWLKPSTIDGSLPDLTIRNKIYSVLHKLPIESDQLRRAEFGKLIAYLRDCKRETATNRNKLRKLVQHWARMIFGKTDNFRMLEQMQHRNDVGIVQEKRKRKKQKSHDLLQNVRNSETPTTEKKRFRAQIPQAHDFQFTKRVGEKKDFQIPKSKTSSRHEALAKRLKSKKIKRSR